MKRSSSKSVIKKFSQKRKAPPESGVWSGRGIGIPVGGAIGGGDDYNQKIGRNRRPYYQGDSGSPSQSADAGFSSLLSRINTSFDEIETIMFPDQEDDKIKFDDDNYDIDHLMRKKIMKLEKPSNMLKQEKNQHSPIMLEQSGLLTSELGDLLGDSARAIVGGVDGLDWIVLIPSLGFNLMQIKNEVDEGKEALRDARSAWRNYETDFENEKMKKKFMKEHVNLENISRGIATDIVDIMQIVIAMAPGSWATSAMSLAPNIGNIKRAGSFLKSLVPGVAKAGPAANLKKGAGRIERLFSNKNSVARKMVNNFIYNTFVQELGPLFDDLQDRLPSGLGSALNPITEGIDMLRALEESITMYNERLESIIMHGDVTKDLKFEPADGDIDDKKKEYQPPPRNIVTSPDDDSAAIAKSPGELTIGDIYAAMLAERSMKKDRALREFIREEILNEYIASQPQSLHPPKPNEYQFHKPLYIENDDGDVLEVEEKFFDDYAAVFSADDGVVPYSPRPTSTNEVRSMIKDILKEKKDKKKRKIEMKHP